MQCKPVQEVYECQWISSSGILDENAQPITNLMDISLTKN